MLFRSRIMGKLVFGRFPLIVMLYTINEAHKQYSLLDTIFNCICYLGPPGKYLYVSPQNSLHVGSRHVVGCLDCFINIFLEVQEKYSSILYLIGYIAYGLHFWYKM